MSKDFNTNTKNNDEWLTPPDIIKALGEFDLDPSSPINRPWETAKKHYTGYRDWETDRKSTRLNSSHLKLSRMPSSA